MSVQVKSRAGTCKINSPLRIGGLCHYFSLGRIVCRLQSLPLGILAAFIVMHYQGVNANFMSLGDITTGVMIDAAVVMIENAHKLRCVY